uniref:Prosaposin n=1 Tax=Anabas testudineus TaxID=64144 RepID=A0A7N6AXU6_ANATE
MHFAAVAIPLLGTEQCARGPPYWCQNVKTASLCGAVTHCQQNVWNKPQMKTVPCDLCKEVLMVVEQILKDNATESEVLGYLEKACQLIPDQGLTAECKEIVDNYYPIIIGILTGELEDPSVACGAMGLCTSQQAALAEVQAQEQIMSNEIPQVDLSQQVVPFLLNVPELLYPQESPKEEAPKQETPKQESGDVCQQCINFITSVQAEAKANSSFVDSLIANYESKCDELGPGMADMCKQYVSQYGPVVVQQLMSMVRKPLYVLPMVRVRDSPTCAICEYVMKQLETMLEDHETEEVKNAVEKVCTFLPSSLTAQCKDLIETYGEAIIELLVQEADPKTVCTVLGLCSGARSAYIRKFSLFNAKWICLLNIFVSGEKKIKQLSPLISPALDQTRFKAGGYCEVCKAAVTYIDSILEKNATEAQIEEAVRKVCNFLPDAFQTECDQMIEQYEPVLVQLLLQMLDPDFVCMKLGACPEAVRRLLGTEQCSWGPAFWCKNMETASRCNAVEHCRRHVWV